MVSEWSNIVESTSSRNYYCLCIWKLHIFIPMSPTMIAYKLVGFVTRATYLIGTFICHYIYSNIEKKYIFDTSLYQPISWFRFTEDADIKWDQSKNELLYMPTHLSNLPMKFLKPKYHFWIPSLYFQMESYVNKYFQQTH